jgi:hypothetical protein
MIDEVKDRTMNDDDDDDDVRVAALQGDTGSNDNDLEGSVLDTTLLPSNL